MAYWLALMLDSKKEDTFVLSTWVLPFQHHQKIYRFGLQQHRTDSPSNPQNLLHNCIMRRNTLSYCHSDTAVIFLFSQISQSCDMTFKKGEYWTVHNTHKLLSTELTDYTKYKLEKNLYNKCSFTPVYLRTIFRRYTMHSP